MAHLQGGNNMSKYLELSKQLTELKKLIVQATEAELKIAFLEIFKKFPDLKTFAWTQYTPYFNDGEPCYFSVNTYSIEINGNWDSGNSKIEKAVTEVLERIDSETMETLFGDHVQVTVNWDGSIKTSEHSHD